MSSSVDNRVVNMQFNNAQFEAGVKQTITSLDSLKQALKFNTAATSLNTVQSAVNHFSLANIEEAVDTLTNKFSTLGIIGMTAISNMTNNVINKVRGTLSQAYGTIVSGGWARASRSAQARFTLEGIFSDSIDKAEKVQEAFDSAKESVADTAYTLDSAVSIASQLATTGVDTGEQMKNTLLGLAGVASTTGANYEMLGDIWVDAAASGKMSNDTLSRLQMQGLGATQVMADYLGTTSDQIHSMATKGLISFEEFADAMTKKFGAHAKDANSTFSGVTANIRAQLTKIGELFASGIIENDDVISFLNTFRKTLGSIKNSISALQEPFKKMTSAIAKFAKQYIKVFDDDNYRITALERIIEVVKKGMEYVTELLGKFTDLKEEIEEEVAGSAMAEAADKLTYTMEHLQKAKDIWEKGTYGNGQARVDALGDEYQNVQDLVNAYVYGGYSWEAAEKMIADSTEDAMGTVTDSTEEAGKALEEASTKTKVVMIAVEAIKSFGSGISSIFNSVRRVLSRVGASLKKSFNWGTLIENIRTAGETFSKWAGYFEITEERADKLGVVFDNIISVLSSIKSAIGKVVKSFTGDFGSSISKAIDWLLDLWVTVSDNLKIFAEWIDKNDILKNTFGTIAAVIGGAIVTVKDFFVSLYNLPAVQEIISRLTELANLIGTKLVGYLGDAKDNVVELFDKFNNSDTSFTERILDKINTALSDMLAFFDELKVKKKEFVDWFEDENADLEETDGKLSKVEGKIKTVKIKLQDIASSKNLGEFANNVSSAFGEAGDKLTEFGNILVEKFKEIDWAKAALVGFSGTLSLFLASSALFTFNLSQLVVAIKSFPFAITGVLKSVSSAIKALGDNFRSQGRAKVIKAFALAIAVLAASLIALTYFTDPDELRAAAISLSILVGVITAAVTALFLIMNKTKSLYKADRAIKSIGVVFIAVAAATLLLALALKTLTTIKWSKKVIAPVVALVSIMVALLGVSALMATFAPKLSEGGFFLVLFAASVWVLIKALEELANLNIKGIQKKMLVLAEALLSIMLVAMFMGNITFSGSLGVFLLVLSIYTIERALKMIVDEGVDFDDVKKNLSKFVIILISLAVIAGYIFVIGMAISKAKGIGITIMLTALSMLVMAKALQEIGKVAAAGTLKSSVTALRAVVGMIFVLMVGLSLVDASTVGNIGSTLIKISIAIGILAAIMALLGNLPVDQVEQGLIILAILVTLAGLLVMVTGVARSISYKTIFALVAAIAVMGLVVGLLAYATKDDPYQLIAPTVAMCALILSLGGAMLMIYKSGTALSNTKSANVLKTMYAMIIMLVIIISGLWLLSQGAPENVISAAVALVLTIAMIAAAMALMFTYFAKAKMSKDKTKNLTILMAMMMAMIMTVSASLSLLVSVIGDNFSTALVAIGAIGAVLLEIALFIYLVQTTITKYAIGPGTSAMIIEMIVLVGVIALSLSAVMLSMGEDYGKALTAAGVIGLVLLFMAGLFLTLKTMPVLSVTTVVAIGLMIAALVAIAGSVRLLLGGNYDYNTYVENAKGLFWVMLVMVAVIGVLAAIGQAASVGAIIGVVSIVAILLAMAVALPRIAVAVDMFADIIKKLTEIEWGNIDLLKLAGLTVIFGLFGVAAAIAGAGLAVLGIGLYAVAKAAVVLAKAFTIVAVGVASIISSLSGIAIAIATISTTMENSSETVTENLSLIGTALALAIVNFATTLANNADKIKDSIHKAIVSVGDMITDFIVTTIDVIGNGILAILTVIDEKAFPITQKIMDILIDILMAIAQKAALIGFYGAYISAAFLTGCIKGIIAVLPELTDALVEAAVTAMAAFANALYENNDEIIAAFKMLSLVLGRTILQAFNVAGIFDEMIEGLDNSIEQQQTLLEQSGFIAVDTYKDGVKEGAEGAAADINDSFETTIENAADQRDVAEEGAEETVDGWWDSAKKKIGDYSGANGLDLTNMLNPDTSSLSSLAGDTADTYVNDLGEAFEKKDVSKLPTDVVHRMIEAGWEYEDANTRSTLIKPIQDMLNESELSFTQPYSEGETELFNAMEDSAPEYQERGEDNGDFYGMGVYTGIKSWDESIYNASAHLAVKADDGWRDKTETDSPSKVGYSLGKFWDLGIANGISDFGNLVYNASSSMADNLLSTTAGLMALVNGVVNDNLTLEPSIAPVVDDNSLALLNSAFGMGNLNIAANTAMSVTNASENTLANQVAALSEQVKKMAETDYSKLLEGVAVNIDNSTTVDGAALRQTSARYTIKQVNNQQQNYAMAIGGRI